MIKSINFLKKNLKNKGVIYVGMSGGKDSVVTAKLMELSGLPYQLYHNFTGIDPPEVVKFIRKNYPSCIFLRSKQTFWHLITTKNPPANFSRWCCTEIKKRSGWKISISSRVMGIRAEESTLRGKYEPVNYIKANKSGRPNHTQFYPILDWNQADIWDFIDDQKLKYPRLYDEGFDRIGCVVCPYHSTKNGKGHELYREKWPKYFDVFERQCAKWFEKRKSQGKEMYFDTPQEFIHEWYLGNVQWYKHD